MQRGFNNFVLRVGAALACVMLLANCAGNPATGGASMVATSESKEASIGAEMHAELMAKGARYDSPQLQDYVNRVGQRLAANSDKPDMVFTFTVMDSADINAFALPGGYIYINRGLLAYLDTEAELAGVLAHEIGHVTARHHGRRQGADITNKVLATTTYILTGSHDLATASSMYGAELVSGYGRDMELEADGLGASYMHKAGYDTDALLEVIGVLKDQEQFQRVQAKASGKTVSSYHGLYSSHPRNDQRLQTVISKAGELDTGGAIDNPELPGDFQRSMEGLVWGPSVQSERAANRYYHNKLAFTFEHPDNWNVTAGAKAIEAGAIDGSAQLTITIRRRDRASTPQAALESVAGSELREGKALEPDPLEGYTGITGSGNSMQRLAVIDYNNLSYIFAGKATDFASADAALLSSIESFRPMYPRERSTGTGRFVRYVQVPRGATIASLAASARIPDAEAQLRLINGLYPHGEPRTGDWIKVIQ